MEAAWSGCAANRQVIARRPERSQAPAIGLGTGAAVSAAGPSEGECPMINMIAAAAVAMSAIVLPPAGTPLPDRPDSFADGLHHQFHGGHGWIVSDYRLVFLESDLSARNAFHR